MVVLDMDWITGSEVDSLRGRPRKNRDELNVCSAGMSSSSTGDVDGGLQAQSRSTWEMRNGGGELVGRGVEVKKRKQKERKEGAGLEEWWQSFRGTLVWSGEMDGARR